VKFFTYAIDNIAYRPVIAILNKKNYLLYPLTPASLGQSGHSTMTNCVSPYEITECNKMVGLPFTGESITGCDVRKADLLNLF